MTPKWSDARVPNAAGHLSARFVKAGDAFAENFAESLELGACFAVMIDGDLVVDIRGGFVDRARERAWGEETLACIYSSSKAVLSIMVAKAVSDGALEYAAPVSRYWPEFGAAGKDAITLAEVLSHQAGLCGFAEEMPPDTWLDWDAIAHKVAAMAPLWPPGSANGYHPQTVGVIIGEIFRRVLGASVGELLTSARAASDMQIFCGMAPPETARTAYMPKPPRAPDLGPLNRYEELAFLKPWSAPARVAREAWLASEIPASNMHADARSLAAFVYPLANQGRNDAGAPVLRPAVVAEALGERVRGDDLVLPFHLSWTAGLMKNINRHFGPNDNAYGHAGFGGSCVVIDPEHRLTAAYVMSKMSPYLVGDPRALRLLNAVYDCL
ncbi:MAG: serine hydrolase domain-containing protein [Hyphococcus sp.]